MNYEETYSRNFLEIIKKACVDVYNHMSYTALMSLIWFFTVGPFALVALNLFNAHLEMEGDPLGLIVGFFLILLVVSVPYMALILGPLHCALYYLGGQIVEDVAKIRDLWEGLRKNYFLAAKVYAIYAALIIFTVVDLYISLFLLQSIFMKVLGVVLLYAFIFLLIIGIYLPGFIVMQNNTVGKVFKKAVFLTLDNTVLSLLVGLAYLGLIVLARVIPFLIPLVMLAYGGLVQFTGVRTFLGLMEKYPDPIEEQGNVSGQE